MFTAGSVRARDFLGLVLTIGSFAASQAGTFDTDIDGIADEADNCVLVANTTQIDTDGDGWGNACDADYNNDGVINFGDYSQLVAAFLTSNANLDINGDGFINFADISMFSMQFLQTPGPAGYANWVTPADGVWDDPNNWFPAALPPPEATVFIDQPGTITVTYPASADNNTVAAMVLNDALIIDASTADVLTVSGDVQANAPLTLDTGVLNVGGTLAINDSIVLIGGRLANANITAVNQPIQLAGGGTPTFDAVTLSADLEITNARQLNIENGLVLNGAVIMISSDNNIAYLNLQGTQSVSGSGEIQFTGTTTSDTLAWVRPISAGDVTISSGITVRTVSTGGRLGSISEGLTMQADVIADLPNRRVTIQGDLLSLQSDVTATNGANITIDGQWQATASASVSVAGGDLGLDGDWENQGSITATNSSVQFGSVDSDSWTNTGTIDLINSPLELDGTFVIGDLGTLTSDSTLTVKGVLDNSGATLDLDNLPGSAFTIGSSGRVLNGAIAGTLPLIIGPSISDANLDGVTMMTDLMVLNASQVDIENGLILQSANIFLTPSNNISYLNLFGTQSLTGSGEIIFDGTSTSNTLALVRPTGTGTVLTIGSGITVRSGIGTGRLGDINQGLVFQGTLVADLPNRTMSVRGNVLDIEGSMSATNGSTINIDGVWNNAVGNTLSASNASLNLEGSWVNNGTIDVQDGNVDFGQVDADSWLNNGTISLLNSPLTLDGSFVTADLGTFSTNSTITMVGVLDNTGLTLDLDALGGSNFQIGASGRIIGGTITGSNPLQVGPSVSDANFDGVTMATDLHVLNASQVDIENGMTLNNVDIVLLPDNNISFANFFGTQTLGGTGQVIFNGTTTSDTLGRIRATGGGAVLTLGSNIAVRSGTTAGRIGESGLGLVLQGSLVSDLPGRTMSLLGNTLDIQGPVTATGGGEILIDGVWVNAPANVISVTDGDLDLQGSWNNSGTLDATNSTVRFGAVDADNWTNTGSIALTNSPLQLDGTFVWADLGTYSSDSSFAVTGILDNTAQTLNLDLINAASFTIGQSGRVLNGIIDGNALLTLGPSVSDMNLDGVTLSADVYLLNASQLDIENGLTLDNATIVTNSDNNIAYVNIVNGQTIDGIGEFQFGGTTTTDSLNRVRSTGTGGSTFGSGITVRALSAGGFLGNTSNDLVIQGPIISGLTGRAITVEGDHLILEGSVNASNGGEIIIEGDWELASGGTITVVDGDLLLDGAWVNLGLITATNSSVAFGNADNDSWTNSGTITLTDSPLSLDGTFAASDLGTISSNLPITLAGVLSNAGQFLDVDNFGGGVFQIESGARINGGTIGGTSSLSVGPFVSTVIFDGVTLETGVIVENGSRLVIENGLNLNNASVTMASTNNIAYLDFAGPQLVSGTGELVFGGTTTGNTLNWIRPTGSSDVLTLGSGITVRADTANGRLGSNSGTWSVVLNGSLVNLRAGGDVDILGADFELGGSITVGDDARVEIQSTVVTFLPSASTDIDISATGTGELSVVNAVSLAGAVNFALQGGFVPADCEAFTFLTYPSFSGGFDTVNGPDLGGGQTFSVDYLPTLAQAVAPGAGC